MFQWWRQPCVLDKLLQHCCFTKLSWLVLPHHVQLITKAIAVDWFSQGKNPLKSSQGWESQGTLITTWHFSFKKVLSLQSSFWKVSVMPAWQILSKVAGLSQVFVVSQPMSLGHLSQVTLTEGTKLDVLAPLIMQSPMSSRSPSSHLHKSQFTEEYDNWHKSILYGIQGN